MINSSNDDYTDLDLKMFPDEPVAEIAQETNIPDVSFLAATDVTMRQEIQNAATGNRLVNPLVLILTTGGYRVRCKSLPRKGKLEIVLATARARDFPVDNKGPIPPDAGFFGRNYALKIDMSNGDRHWFGHGSDARGRIEDVFVDGRYVPRKVRIEGTYSVRGDPRAISQVFDVKDVLGDAIREIRGSHP
jgi:hypothetical protein